MRAGAQQAADASADAGGGAAGDLAGGAAGDLADGGAAGDLVGCQRAADGATWRGASSFLSTKEPSLRKVVKKVQLLANLPVDPPFL